MSPEISDLLKRALALSVDERAALAHTLLDSLEGTDESVQEAWDDDTPSIAALIRDNKTFRIQSDIQTGAKYGMVTLDSFLIEKYLAGMIAREEVLTKAQDPVTIQAKLQELELAQAIGMDTAPPQGDGQP